MPPKKKEQEPAALDLEKAAEVGHLGTLPEGSPERRRFAAPPIGDTAPSKADEPTGTDPRTGLPAKSVQTDGAELASGGEGEGA